VEKSVCNSPGGALITLNFFKLTTKRVSARSHYAQCWSAQLQRQHSRLLCQYSINGILCAVEAAWPLWLPRISMHGHDIISR